uniref:Phage integrase domain protein SAM domain protein n=1 Tax=Rhodopseudomonas palustris (strain BisA53) TaxID=316055 RepID=Q07PM8_RHOP5
MANSESRTAGGLIVRTDASCRINDNVYPGIPTLVWPDGIDEVASDWFRYLAVETGAAASSVYEYAKVLRPFRRFCRSRGRAWDSVDDDFLVVWRENMRRVDKVDIPRINTSLQTIFAFYCWAEERGYLRFHVGIYDLTELPNDVRANHFAITARKVFRKSRHGRVVGTWVTRLGLSVPRSTQGRRHTPSEDETRRIHEVALGREFGERNTLMYSWAEETGARRAEILRVNLSQLPTPDQLDEIVEMGESWPIAIVRKGEAVWSINAPADLLLRTLDWVNHGRAQIVANCRNATVGYQEPNTVFISSRTGVALHRDSVTKFSGLDFAAAGVSNASLHRFRAKYCIEVIEALVDAVFANNLMEGSMSSWVETILIKASEQMGHMSPASLRPYLNYVLDRKVRTAEATKVQSLTSSIRQLECHRNTLRRTVDLNTHLREIAICIDLGKKNQAVELLRQLLSDVNGQNTMRRFEAFQDDK